MKNFEKVLSKNFEKVLSKVSHLRSLRSLDETISKNFEKVLSKEGDASHTLSFIKRGVAL